MIKAKKLLLFLMATICLFSIGCANKQNNNQNGGEENMNNNNDSLEEISKINKGEIDNFNSYLKLFGRTYFNNGRLALDHAGTGFEISFKGQNLSLEMVAASTTVLLDIFIDGGECQTIKLTRNGSVKIAKDLDDGNHTIRVLKASSTATGAIYISDIITDGTILKPSKEYKIDIEFIGDSITCGAGILVEASEEPKFINSDVCKAYSYICASMLDASFSMVATEGICTKATKYVVINAIDMYKCYSLNNRASFSFNTHPDIVVIDMGANDASVLASDANYLESFSNAYLELVMLVRDKHPDAYIVCIYGHTWSNEQIRSSILKVVSDLNSIGDNKVSYFQVSADKGGAGGHPGLKGASRQGEELYNYIKNSILSD